MKLAYHAQKSSRFKKTHFISFRKYKGMDFRYFYSIDLTLGYENQNIIRGNYSTCEDCTNIRKFRRKLRKMSGFVPSGTIFCLLSRYTGFTVFGRIK